MRLTKRQLKKLIKEEIGMNESRLIKESSATESALFEAIDNYIIMLDEELGYEVPEDRLKDALLAQVDNYFKTVSQENADYWQTGK